MNDIFCINNVSFVESVNNVNDMPSCLNSLIDNMLNHRKEVARRSIRRDLLDDNFDRSVYLRLLKECNTITLNCGRQAGHTTSIINVIPNRFQNSLIFCNNEDVCRHFVYTLEDTGQFDVVRMSGGFYEAVTSVINGNFVDGSKENTFIDVTMYVSTPHRRIIEYFHRLGQERRALDAVIVDNASASSSYMEFYEEVALDNLQRNQNSFLILIG